MFVILTMSIQRKVYLDMYNEHIFIWAPLCRHLKVISSSRVPLSKGLQWPWTRFLRLRLMPYQTSWNVCNPCLDIFSPLTQWYYEHSAFRLRVCSDLEPNLKVQCQGHIVLYYLPWPNTSYWVLVGKRCIVMLNHLSFV